MLTVMVWLYLLSLSLIAAGELNAVLQHRAASARGESSGSPKSR
jgi:uncharacterized BrkB/YihY/UPF0761 family membrane protein